MYHKVHINCWSVKPWFDMKKQVPPLGLILIPSYIMIHFLSILIFNFYFEYYKTVVLSQLIQT
ncbi:MAG: hypothetical protein B6242_01110 [Anaerolineaceae bacterium 4572_78]|nr:MAG: hypothetical protein B6242_01110 [Anaerolineaceae bacterium 4572_78]